MHDEWEECILKGAKQVIALWAHYLVNRHSDVEVANVRNN